MPIDRRQPDKYKARANLYTQVIESTGSRMIHIAGTVPMDENGTPFTGSIREQAEMVSKNIVHFSRRIRRHALGCGADQPIHH